MTMKFKATKQLVLSECLELSSSITKAEAYQLTNDKSAHIDLTIKDSVNGIDLYQNKPNPFIESTVITFSTSSEEQVNLSFYSVTGELIHQLNMLSSNGLNEVIIDKTIFPSQGVYFYELSNATKSQYKKLMLIE